MRFKGSKSWSKVEKDPNSFLTIVTTGPNCRFCYWRRDFSCFYHYLSNGSTSIIEWDSTESNVIWTAINSGMNNIVQGIAFITIPRNVFPADNARRNRCQISSTPSARTPVIHSIVSLVTSSIKAKYYW